MGPSKVHHGFGNFAVGNEAFVKNEPALDAIGPLALIVKGICGGEQARAGDEPGGRGAVHDEEFAFFGFEIVFGVVGVKNIASGVMNEVNMAARVRPSSVLVEIDFIGSDGHFGGVNLGAAFEIFPLTLRIFVRLLLPRFRCREEDQFSQRCGRRFGQNREEKAKATECN